MDNQNAKIATDIMSEELENNKIEMEENTMSEKKTNENETNENNPGTKRPVKKPVANAKASEEKKPGLLKRIGNWWKANWKYAAAGAGGAVAGAGITYGVGKIGESRARKQSVQTYDDNPVDFNS